MVKKIILGIIGLGLIVFAALGLYWWWLDEFVFVVKGLATPFIVFVGLLVILIGLV